MAKDLLGTISIVITVAVVLGIAPFIIGEVYETLPNDTFNYNQSWNTSTAGTSVKLTHCGEIVGSETVTNASGVTATKDTDYLFPGNCTITGLGTETLPAQSDAWVQYNYYDKPTMGQDVITPIANALNIAVVMLIVLVAGAILAILTKGPGFGGGRYGGE